MTHSAQDVGDHSADGAIITPSYAYGLNNQCTNNLHFLEGQRLLFSAGRFFTCLSGDEKACAGSLLSGRLT